MPKYNFVCEKCDAEESRILSISDFLKVKKEKIKCEHCKDGVLFHQIASVSSLIEKSKDQVVLDLQDEVRKTVDKVRSGDQKTITDIYGDKPNPYKK